MPQDGRDRDDGFTLIELAVTVVVMTIVLGALTMGVVTLLRTTGVTTDRLVGSHDAQLLTEWITTDIQSAASAPNVATTTKPGCADDASLPASGVNVAQMTWTDRSTGLVYHAAYRTEQVSAGPPQNWQLVRYFCQEGQASTHFPVARGLQDGSVCPIGVVDASAVCVVPQPWPRFDVRLTSVAGSQSYTFTVSVTGRTAAAAAMDATPPNFVSAVAYNTDSSGIGGAINRVVVTFNEALNPAYTAPLTRWTLHNAPNSATITSVAVSNRTATLNLAASGSPPVITVTAAFTIDLQPDANGVRDGAGNRASFVGMPVSDGMAPLLVSAIAVDSDTDAKIDRIDITPSETIQTTSPNPAKFHLASADPAWAPVLISGTTVVSNTVLLTLGSTPPGTGVPTDLTVAMDADPSAVRDASPAHNFTAWPATLVTDGNAPELTSLISQDTDQNGTLDEIVATFSEPVVASTDRTQWSVTEPGWPSSPRVSVVNVNGPQVTLIIDPTLTGGQALPVDTAALGLKVSTSAGIADPGGNNSSFVNRPVQDRMAPVFHSESFNRGSTAGIFETNDSAVMTFSEPLASPSTATVPVTLDWQAGQPNATVDIPGLTAGPVDLGIGGYFSADGNDAAWPATVNRSGPTVTVTLTGTCTGSGCASLSPGPPAVTTMKASSLLKDLAGNAALDKSVTIQWF